MGAIIALPGMYVRFWLNVMNRAAYIIGFAIGATIRFFVLLPGRIMGAVRSIPPALAALWSLVWTRTKATVSSGANAVVGFFAALPTRSQRAVSALWSRISGAFISAKNAASAKAQELVTGALRWLGQLPSRAGAALRTMRSRVLGAFAGAGSWLVQAGRDVLMGLARGIAGAIGSVVAEARRVASSVVSGIKSGLGIGSASIVMRDQVGRWIPPGIALGLRAAMPGLLGTVGSAMSAVTNAASVRARSNFELGLGSHATGQAMPAGLGNGGGTLVMIEVNGALDPAAVGHQVVTLLLRWAQSQGKTLDIVK
jgi:phage-related protein